MCETGAEMYALMEKIFPICRSITGDGVRETLKLLKGYIANDKLDIFEVPTGTEAFDWTVPREWLVRDGYIDDENGERIVSFKENNLHILGYSAPVDEVVDLETLLRYIYTQPDQPDVVPYVTSYYRERSGFCMSERQKKSLKPGRYHIYIDSELKEGSLTYGQIIYPGKTKDEVLISTYSCHPGMANDNCSGLVLTAELAKFIGDLNDRRYTYRIVIAPETIGPITYLSRDDNLRYMKEYVKAGFVITCVGLDGDYSIVHTRTEDTLSDRVLMNIYGDGSIPADRCREYSFLTRGSDSRQWDSPGVDLGVVEFCRTKYYDFPEYHTSADNMDFVSPKGLEDSFVVMKKVIEALEYNQYYRTTVPCEPQLGKRGLYPEIGQKNTYDDVTPMIDFLAYADGKYDLIEISNMIKQPIARLIPIIDTLKSNGLITF